MKKTSLRLLTLMMAAFVSVSLVSCGGDDGGSGTGGGGNGGGGNGDKPASNATYNIYINTSALTTDNFKLFDYKYSISDFTTTDQTITQAGELLVLEGQKDFKGTVTIKVTPKAGIESIIDPKATYSLVGLSAIKVRISSSDGKSWESTAKTEIINKNGVFILANLAYFTAQKSLSLTASGLEENTQQEPNMYEVYSYYLDTSNLTVDNFKFFDYKFTVDGTSFQNVSITKAGLTNVISNLREDDKKRIYVNITPKENVTSVIDKSATYSLADFRAIKFVAVSSDGVTYESQNTVNVVTNTGHYLLANLGYFVNTFVAETNGSNIQFSAQSSQPALVDPGFDITQGEAIDLGLSVLWASENVVTTKQVHNNSYFAWGETKTKNDYVWNTYTMLSNGWVSTYNTPSDTRLHPADDVANVVLGGNWRMPTKAEAQELVDKCTWEWGTYIGYKGYKVTGPNGKSIFLQAAGHLEHNTILLYGMAVGYNQLGSYWTSDLLTTTGQYAYQLGAALSFSQTSIRTDDTFSRCGGLTVRAVLPK